MQTESAGTRSIREAAAIVSFCRRHDWGTDAVVGMAADGTYQIECLHDEHGYTTLPAHAATVRRWAGY